MISPRYRIPTLVATTVILLAPDVGAQARHGKRARVRARAASRVPAALKGIGYPRVVVAHRRDITAFARTAAALKRRSMFPVQVVPLEPRDPIADLREDIEEAKPRVVVALGPLAARVCARGFGAAAVVFAFRTSPPETTVRRGGWLRHGARPRDVLRWLRRLRPKLRDLGVVLLSPQDPLVPRVKRAAKRLGIQAHLAYESAAGNPLRALMSLLRQRPGALWLGVSVELWTPLQLRAAQRLQSLFRIPVVGLTAEHVRRGLALAIDSTPQTVAKRVEAFIRAHVRRWLAPPEPEVQEAPPRRRDRAHRRRGHRRRRRRRRLRHARRPRPRVEASQLAVGRVPAHHVTINVHQLKALGVDPRAAIAAGAIQVQP